MRRFAEFYARVDATTSTDAKLAAMVGYFRGVPDADAAWAVYFLSGQRLKGTVSTRVLWAAALEATGIAEWLLGECVDAVGDFSETISLLLPEPTSPIERSLDDTVRSHILPLIHAPEGDKQRLIREAWHSLPASQRFVFHKALRGGFRVGVHRKLVVRALAEVAGIEPGVIEHRLGGRFEPTPEAYRNIISLQPDTTQNLLRPYPFYLARQLDDPPESLGAIEDWQLEWKWDGVRAQLIRREPGPTLALWSRGDEPMDRAFPELLDASRSLPQACVLDGEVLIWNGPIIGGKVRSFSHLQERLNRRVAPSSQLSLFEGDRAVFMAYDLLELESVDLRARPLRERRRALEQLLVAKGPASVWQSTIGLSPMLEAATWRDAELIREQSRDQGTEGLMLKPRDSIYAVGRSAGAAAAGEPSRAGATGWWKWKVQPLSVDAVLTHAQPGSGRRAGLYTDYTFGLWTTTPEGVRSLVTFAKAYSGLSQLEIEQVDAWVRSHIRVKFGPVVEVEPKLVFEIAFEGLAESGRHRSGIAVRFPRMARWRTDKPAHEADDLGRLRALLRAQEDRR